jgi:hypothetical protein
LVIDSHFAILHLMVPRDPAIFGIPVDFILFGLTLLCIAVFHQHTMRVALAGLVTVVIYKILFTGPIAFRSSAWRYGWQFSHLRDSAGLTGNYFPAH